MARFVARRLVWTVVVLFAVVTLLFLVMRSIGGNPFRHGPLLGLSNEAWVKYGDYQPKAIQDNQRRLYGLDRPWYRQYADYVESVAQLDFGPSLSYRNRDVNEILRDQGPVSLELVGLAAAWALVLGLPLGLLAGIRPGRIEDRAATVVALAGYAIPSFLLGTAAIWLFAVELHWVPTTAADGRWSELVLPSLTLGLLPTAYVARLTRAGVVEAMEQEFVQAARARGLRRRRVVLVHALRPALIPVVTAAGPLLGTLLTGLFVVEDVFQVPGIGRFYVAGVAARDYPLVLGLTIVAAALVILANATVDVLHGVLDPRTREPSV
jgi:ABC-type dipeptide/oligopeptide/nickel transport system permease component